MGGGHTGSKLDSANTGAPVLINLLISFDYFVESDRILARSTLVVACILLIGSGAHILTNLSSVHPADTVDGAHDELV